MVVVRNLFILFLVGVLIISPALQPVADATVATGAVTGRGVFSLTASGAAKLGLAESQVAAGVRVLGMLGRVSGTVTVGIVAYQITSGLWDWWQSTYEAGEAMTMGPVEEMGNFGIQSGAGVGFCSYAQRWTSGTGQVYWVDLSSSCNVANPYSGWLIVGQRQWTQYSGDYTIEILNWVYMASSLLPPGSISHVDQSVGESGRAGLVADFDSGKAFLLELNAADQAAITAQAGQDHAFQGATLGSLVGIIDVARGVVSGGVALDAGDATVVDAGASVGSQPGAIPGSGESTVPDSGAATAAALAAVAAALTASGAAVVSAVNAVAAAVAAAAVATYTPIVSAVQAIAAPIVDAINEAKTAIVSAVSSAPAGGGSAGTTSAVNDLAAQQTARNAAAQAAAAAAAPADVICPECVRDDKWSEAWGTLSAAGQAAPVFGLINRIVINPVGTIQRVRTVSTANFGVMTFDLTAWGIDTYIGVVRYVVIFAALIAGYFVIFG